MKLLRKQKRVQTEQSRALNSGDCSSFETRDGGQGLSDLLESLVLEVVEWGLSAGEREDFARGRAGGRGWMTPWKISRLCMVRHGARL